MAENETNGHLPPLSTVESKEHLIKQDWNDKRFYISIHIPYYSYLWQTQIKLKKQQALLHKTVLKFLIHISKAC